MSRIHLAILCDLTRATLALTLSLSTHKHVNGCTSQLSFDVVFGPAYKGIPLGAAVAQALYDRHGRDVEYSYNRKEKKVRVVGRCHCRDSRASSCHVHTVQSSCDRATPSHCYRCVTPSGVCK
jgi:hypothetical protein